MGALGVQDEALDTPASARHKRGCNCKKSLCLKKYCECYQVLSTILDFVSVGLLYKFRLPQTLKRIGVVVDRLVWAVQKGVGVKDARICMAGRKVGVSFAVEFCFLVYM